MNTPIFTEKLDALTATLDLMASYDVGGIATALARGCDRHALAIGSGGSAIAAEYLLRCRDTLGLGPTTVATPMQGVLDHHRLDATDAWIFSAGGDNPDACAIAQALTDREAATINLITRNPHGAAAAIVTRSGGTVHALPVADAKDGYLATHSVFAMTTALLLASHFVSREPDTVNEALGRVASLLLASRDAGNRDLLVKRWTPIRATDTIIITADSSLRPVASLLDTSLWEASLCQVQTTDFRNFAHGRHAWLHHRPDSTIVLALTAMNSRIAWSAIETVLPKNVRRNVLDYNAGGRLDNLLGIVDGLSHIEAIGEVLGVDPGKPGLGDFGRAIYDDRSLEVTAMELRPRIRHKLAAIAKADRPMADEPGLVAIGHHHLETLAAATVGGAVFDYDGTIVTTEGRFSPPSQEILDELIRLHRAGVCLGIATGRGGAAGEDLRKVLPPDVLSSLLVGYYNGGHLRTADIDIKGDPPRQNPAIAATAAWLDERDDLFASKEFKSGPVQIGIDMENLLRPFRFPLDMAECPLVSSGEVRISGSGHSFDVVPSTSCKSAIVDAVRRKINPDAAVLCFGDSGSRFGNDYTLLAHPHGISVGEVCGAADGCWSLFGRALTGPDALLKILRALVKCPTGEIRLDTAALALDTP